MQGPTDFPETRRSVWDAIRKGGSELERVLALYRDPIARWLVRRGLSAEDAEDVTQEVLTRLAGGVLEKADARRGRLRALIKAVTRHALSEHRRAASAEKRGGLVDHVPLDAVDVTGDDAPADDFDAEWALNLVMKAMYRLLVGADEGRKRNVEAVYKHALKELGTSDLAKELGVTPANAKVILHRGRKLVAEEVLSMIAEYTVTGDEQSRELAFLERLLPAGLAASPPS